MPDIIADKYEVMETIGRGGMGTVYKARQRNLDRIVAIKMLSEELASDPEFRARFQQEATVVARLNHPNIVQVHDIEQHNNTFCIIMEFVDGENLQAKIDRDVTLPEQEVVAIGAQVSRALAYAHSKGIIHRDIKPDNIHVTPKGVAKVMDFGIARFLDSKLKTQTGISMGTPKFMSPEQVTGKNVDGQTDLYSLGICMYYCLAGRPPFDGENAISVATRHLYEQPEIPSKLNPSISPAVEAVVLKALEKQKANRYSTGVEMAEALESLMNNTPIRGGFDSTEVVAGATQKMPAQNYGSSLPTPGPLQTEDEDYGFDTAVSSVAPANLTPGGSRSVPELDPEFRTPKGDSASSDPTRSFRLSLMFFGALVFFAVLLLILLVVWLRASDQSTLRSLSENPNQQVERPVTGNSATAETQTQDWLDRVTAYAKNKQYAMAAAYTRALSARSPKLASTVRGLIPDNELSNDADDIRRAQESFAAATRLSASDDKKLDLLITAVENNRSEPRYWAALGDYFLSSGSGSDAKVMYEESRNNKPDAALERHIKQQISQLD